MTESLFPLNVRWSEPLADINLSDPRQSDATKLPTPRTTPIPMPRGSLDADQGGRKQSEKGARRTGDVFIKILYASGILVALAPVIILLAYSSKLSHSLGQSGCLPDGTFTFPHTSSIWDINAPLIINIPVNSGGWSFSRAKAISTVWELGAGRGLQVALSLMALQVFSRALLRLMEREEVPFRTYGAVSFRPGGFLSFFPILRAMLNSSTIATESGKQVRRTGKGRVVLAALAFLTLYIAALPTLFSTMAGYAPVTHPQVTYNVPQNVATAFLGETIATVSCSDALVRASATTWQCGDTTFSDADFSSGNATGTCTASASSSGGAAYVWGFSFNMTLGVSILNAAAALVLYAVWLFGTAARTAEGTRRGGRGERFSALRAAVDMAVQARALHGDGVLDGSWGAGELERRVYGGRRGMRFDADDARWDYRLRKRWWSSGSGRVGGGDYGKPYDAAERGQVVVVEEAGPAEESGAAEEARAAEVGRHRLASRSEVSVSRFREEDID